jgi:hypothetical protein
MPSHGTRVLGERRGDVRMAKTALIQITTAVEAMRAGGNGVAKLEEAVAIFREVLKMTVDPVTRDGET